MTDTHLAPVDIIHTTPSNGALPPVDALDRVALFNDILALDIQKEAPPITLCLASITKNEAIPRFARLNVTERMAQSFREMIGAFLHPYRQDAQQGNLSFPEFGVESSPDAFEIETLNLATYTPILDQINPLTALSALEAFDNDKKFLAGMRFYTIVMQVDNGDPIYFFRVHSQQKLLSRSWFLAIQDSEGRFDTIKDTVMAFDQQFDCIYRSGILFVLDKNNFQTVFRFFETIRVKARETLTTINTTIPIHNVEALVQACESNVTMLHKLKRISKKSYFKDLTMKDIKRVIEVHKLKVPIIEVNGQEKVLFDPTARGQEKYVLLRIFNDDYLKSVMTDRNYEVTDKREM